MPRSPEPSSELDATGRKLYFRIRDWIAEQADWAISDQLLLNQACLYEQRAREAREEFRHDNDGYTSTGSTGSPVVNPIIRVAETAEKQYIECLKELGLTPKARQQFKIEPKPSGDDPLADAFG